VTGAFYGLGAPKFPPSPLQIAEPGDTLCAKCMFERTTERLGGQAVTKPDEPSPKIPPRPSCGHNLPSATDRLPKAMRRASVKSLRRS
jgi:hypothetical protein